MTEPMLMSECCNAKMWASLGDGVLIGTCSVCQKDVARYNRDLDRYEWLDGKDPWTTEPCRWMGAAVDDIG